MSDELQGIIEICDGTRGPEDEERDPWQTIGDHAKRARRKVQALVAAVREYLEWGPMTGSDRDLHEKALRAAVAPFEVKL